MGTSVEIRSWLSKAEKSKSRVVREWEWAAAVRLGVLCREGSEGKSKLWWAAVEPSGLPLLLLLLLLGSELGSSLWSERN